MIAITGGEPLMKEGIFELLGVIGRLGFPFGIVTNGVLVDRPQAQRLVDTGIGSISLSLDAPPGINDTLRGKGTASKVERAIASLDACSYRGKLEIVSTITKPAVAYLDDMRRHVAALKVPLWRVVPVMPIGRAAAHPDLIPDANDLRTILNYVAKGREDGLKPKPEFGEECYLGDLYEGMVRPYLFQCRAGITIGGIMADGTIGACPELSEVFIQGNILKDRFQDVWEAGYEVFRDRSWTRKGICSVCDAFSRCHGGSFHLYPDRDSEILRCFYEMLKHGHSFQ